MRKYSQRLQLYVNARVIQKREKTALYLTDFYLKRTETIKSRRPASSLREANVLQPYLFACRMSVYSPLYLQQQFGQSINVTPKTRTLHELDWSGFPEF